MFDLPELAKHQKEFLVDCDLIEGRRRITDPVKKPA